MFRVGGWSCGFSTGHRHLNTGAITYFVVKEIGNKVNQVKEAFKDATPIERLVNECKCLQLVMRCNVNAVTIVNIYAGEVHYIVRLRNGDDCFMQIL